MSQFFEGKQVTVKLDMPATQKGVDIYLGKSQPLDTKSYASRMKRFGISLRNGDTLVITKIKVKNDSVEFQLGGVAMERPWTRRMNPFTSSPRKKAVMKRNWKIS